MMRCGGHFWDAITRTSGNDRLSYGQYTVLSLMVIRPLKWLSLRSAVIMPAASFIVKT